MVFPGQGSQRPAMGAQWARHRAFALVRRAERRLGRPLEPMLVDPERPPSGTAEHQLAVTLCSAMAWAVLKEAVLKEAALEAPEWKEASFPAVVAGHSLGLISALHAAGSLGEDELVDVVAARGELTGAAGRRRPGAMAAMLTSADIAHRCCAGVNERYGLAVVWVANDNAPGQTVITGTAEAVREAGREAIERGVREVVALDVAGAFHSPLLREAAREFERRLALVPFEPTRVPLAVNGRLLPAGTDPDELRARVAGDLTATLLWRETQLLIAEAPGGPRVTDLVECGYGRTLTGLAKRTIGGVALHNAASPEAVAAVARTLCELVGPRGGAR
ncbi:hypothetical protein BU197_23405 [Streptomyces sp. CBMA291]|nr:hypothetical protein [Streptomyces sp. CBMA291]MBD0714244.1 hypothetical protein [Streptomyces sp. CBMA370]